MDHLESPKELAVRIGWPERRVRFLITNADLRHMRIGNRIFIPSGAVEEYIERNMVEPKG